jgi:5,6-dimethylbenzimidazole synthase
MMREAQATPPSFDAEFRAALRDLILWRRDVRRFKTDAIEAALILSLIELAARSPSVGFSQPWRFVPVECPERGRPFADRSRAPTLRR